MYDVFYIISKFYSKIYPHACNSDCTWTIISSILCIWYNNYFKYDLRSEYVFKNFFWEDLKPNKFD